MKSKSKTHRFIGAAIVAVAILIQAAAANFAQTRQQPQIRPPAQSTGDFNTTPTIIVAPNEDYRIGPRDVIEIRVEDAPELSFAIPVNADGTFLMNYLGRIKAQDKTPEELSREIADGLRGKYLKNPQVIVAVKQYYSRSFFIAGAVQRPGVYQIEGRPSLFKLITVAGGLKDNYGSTAFVMREIREKKAESANNGTEIKQVSINAQNTAGQIARPNDEDTADYDVKTVNISGLLRGQIGNNIFLEPGDFVNVPPSDVFYVAGEVNAPGPFPLSEGTTLRQAMALAQGTTFNAASGDGVIFRTDLATGRRDEIKVNINDVMKNKKPDMTLQANDIVMVPNSKGKTIGNAILKAFGLGAAQRGPYRY
jgi:polysaccharide export outer membrane protein